MSKKKTTSKSDKHTHRDAESYGLINGKIMFRKFFFFKNALGINVFLGCARKLRLSGGRVKVALLCLSKINYWSIKTFSHLIIYFHPAKISFIHYTMPIFYLSFSLSVSFILYTPAVKIYLTYCTQHTFIRTRSLYSLRFFILFIQWLPSSSYNHNHHWRLWDTNKTWM